MIRYTSMMYLSFAIGAHAWLSAKAAFGQTTPLDFIKITSPHEGFFECEDSIQKVLPHRSDNLQNQSRLKLDKVDSIQMLFYQRSDSLKNALQHKLHFCQEAESNLRAKMDSLSSRDLPSSEVREKLDSIASLRDQTVASFDQKLQSLKDHTSKKLNELDLPSAAKEKVTSVTMSINGFNLRGADGVPGIKSLPNPLGNMEAMGMLKIFLV